MFIPKDEKNKNTRNRKFCKESARLPYFRQGLRRGLRLLAGPAVPGLEALGAELRAADALEARGRARRGPLLAETLCAMARLTYFSRLPARSAHVSGAISVLVAHLGLANVVASAWCRITAEVCARQECLPAETNVTA